MWSLGCNSIVFTTHTYLTIYINIDIHTYMSFSFKTDEERILHNSFHILVPGTSATSVFGFSKAL